MTSIGLTIDIALPTVTEEKTVKRSWHLAKHLVSDDGRSESFVAGRAAGENDLRAVLAAMSPEARERVIGKYLEPERNQLADAVRNHRHEAVRRANAELEVQRLRKALGTVEREACVALSPPAQGPAEPYRDPFAAAHSRRRGQFW